MAADVLSRRPARAAGVLCALPREGIGGLAEVEERELGRVGGQYRQTLEAVSLSGSADDRNESGVAWHARYVSDVFAALLEAGYGGPLAGFGDFDGGSDYWRGAGGAVIGPDWAAAGDYHGVTYRDFDGAAVGVCAELRVAGGGRVSVAILRARRMGGDSGAFERIGSDFYSGISAWLLVSMWSFDCGAGGNVVGDFGEVCELCSGDGCHGGERVSDDGDYCGFRAGEKGRGIMRPRRRDALLTTHLFVYTIKSGV
jgi:hypothetical protein